MVVVGNAACWGIVALVWAAGAVYNAGHGPRRRIPGQGTIGLAVTGLVCALLAGSAHRYWHDVAVGAVWVRALGLAVLVVSTAFAVWARVSLGTMWSWSPTVKAAHELRTHGAYAVTRHPIYTGLLGMLLGTTLLSGIGRWVVLFPIGLVVLEVKIRTEERLMLVTFPESYPCYRRRVPQLVPGLVALRRRLPLDTQASR